MGLHDALNKWTLLWHLAALQTAIWLRLCISLLVCSSHPEETLTDEFLENSSLLKPFKMAKDGIIFRPVSHYPN